jgi:hypothetical protein
MPVQATRAGCVKYFNLQGRSSSRAHIATPLRGAQVASASGVPRPASSSRLPPCMSVARPRESAAWYNMPRGGAPVCPRRCRRTRDAPPLRRRAPTCAAPAAAGSCGRGGPPRIPRHTHARPRGTRLSALQQSPARATRLPCVFLHSKQNIESARANHRRACVARTRQECGCVPRPRGAVLDGPLRSALRLQAHERLRRCVHGVPGSGMPAHLRVCQPWWRWAVHVCDG